MNKNYRYLIYSILLTITGFAIWFAYEDQQKIFSAISQIGWKGFAFLCFFSLLNYGLRYVRWTLMLSHLGDHFPHVDGLICYLSGFALTTTPAKAGEAIKCMYFNRRYGIHYGHGLASVLIEKVTDALSSMFIAAMALYVFQEIRWVGIGFIIFIAIIILLISQPKLLVELSHLLRFIKVKVFHKLLDLVPVFLERSTSLLAFKPFVGGTLVGFMAWSCEAYAFAWLIQRLGGEASVLLYMSIFAIAMVGGALTFMPGGIGGAEAILFLLLKITGLGDVEAITATFLCRLATLWFAVGLGLLSILWLETHPLKPQKNLSSS